MWTNDKILRLCFISSLLLSGCSKGGGDANGGGSPNAIKGESQSGDQHPSKTNVTDGSKKSDNRAIPANADPTMASSDAITPRPEKKDSASSPEKKVVIEVPPVKTEAAPSTQVAAPPEKVATAPSTAMPTSLEPQNVSPTKPALAPGTHDLSEQFPWPAQIQKGNTCHIYAAAALFEAACHRRLHKDVKVSEALLFYQHLAESVNEVDAGVFTADRFYWSDDEITIYDVGAADRDLNRILAGQVLSESELPFTPEFASRLRSATAISHKEYSWLSQIPKTNAESKRPSYIKGLKTATSMFLDYMQRIRGKAEADFKTKDKDLESCLKQKFELSEFRNMPNGKIVERLNANQPVLCSTSMRTWLGETVKHSFVIIGYRKDGMMEFGTDFLIRDSSDPEAKWGNTLSSCNFGWVLD